MSIASAILILVTLISILYFLLFIATTANIKPEEKSNFWYPALFFDPLWPFYKAMYLPGAKKQLFLGKILFIIDCILWVIWFQLK